MYFLLVSSFSYRDSGPSCWANEASLCFPAHHGGQCGGEDAGTGGAEAEIGSTGHSAGADAAGQKYVVFVLGCRS